MHCCISVCGYTASIAAGKPVRPSTQAIIGNFKDAYNIKKEMDFYTPEEFKKFIAAVKDRAEADRTSIYEWNFYIFFYIAFYTGMRKGEINALKWTDIYDDVIHVRRLGHSNVQETWNTYSHMYPAEAERALQVLNSI